MAEEICYKISPELSGEVHFATDDSLNDNTNIECSTKEITSQEKSLILYKAGAICIIGTAILVFSDPLWLLMIWPCTYGLIIPGIKMDPNYQSPF